MAESTSREQLSTPAGRYTFVAPSPGRRLVQVSMLFSALGFVYAAYLLMTIGGQEVLTVTVVMAVLSVAQWTLLQARIPQKIEVDKSVITIIKNGHRQRYDLVDPGVELRVRDGEIAFAHYMKPWCVVRAKDVDWHVFIDILMHYQKHADLNAELRDQRFKR